MRVMYGLAALAIAAFAAPTWAKDQPAETTVVCKDGSTSKGGKGACSGHGGVDKKATEAAAPTKETKKEKQAKEKEATAPGAETTVVCKDGSTSKGGKGACSGHGGVEKKATKAGAEAAAPAPAAAPPEHAARAAGSAGSAAPANAKNTDPTGAIARCKDGTYSHAQHHSGACSDHGGVADWLDKAAK